MKIFTLQKYILSGIFFIIIIMISCIIPARADDTPQLDFMITARSISGHVSDGFVIGKGRVTYRPSHNGFVVWSNALSAGTPQTYIIKGQRNSRNHIRVKIESENGVPDTERGTGILILTGDDYESFVVAVDGGQQISADKYDVQVNASVIFP